MLFYPAGVSETEILFPYGPASFASEFGPLAGNHFLTVIDGAERPAGARRAGRLARGAGDCVRRVKC